MFEETYQLLLFIVKQKRCRSPAVAPQRIEKVIAECQDEIKLALLQGKYLHKQWLKYLMCAIFHHHRFSGLGDVAKLDTTAAAYLTVSSEYYGKISKNM
jgi:hypothetical protein